jgi:hypothetical protein
MKKTFTITIVSRESRIPVTQSVVIFGGEERPAPEDWKDDPIFQLRVIEHGEEMMHEMFDVEIEEGEESEFIVEPMYRQSVVDKMIERAEDSAFDRGVEVGQNISDI